MIPVAVFFIGNGVVQLIDKIIELGAKKTELYSEIENL